jgi:hypothetical protein
MLPGIASCILLFRAAPAAANSASAGVVTDDPEARLVELLATGRDGGAKTDIAALCELQEEHYKRSMTMIQSGLISDGRLLATINTLSAFTVLC